MNWQIINFFFVNKRTVEHSFYTKLEKLIIPMLDFTYF